MLYFVYRSIYGERALDVGGERWWGGGNLANGHQSKIIILMRVAVALSRGAEYLKINFWKFNNTKTRIL